MVPWHSRFVTDWEVVDSMRRIQKGALWSPVGSNDGFCEVKKSGVRVILLPCWRAPDANRLV